MDPIPEEFGSIEEAADFWDTHDLTDYEEYLKPADFTVDIQRRSFLVSLEPEIARQLTRVAASRGVSGETLVNLWVGEKVKELSS